MSAPKRIQRKRTKGWRMPEGAIYVGRPTRWGNPFPIEDAWTMWITVGLGYRADKPGRRAVAVELYRAWLHERPIQIHRDRNGRGEGIEFANGSVVTIADHCSNLALSMALLTPEPAPPGPRPSPYEIQVELRGHDLACWCPLDQPCHADILLELANR